MSASFNPVRSIISVLPNAVMVAQLSYNVISTTFKHHILLSGDGFWFMLTEFYKSNFTLTCNLPCESAVYKFNLPSDVPVRVVTMHTWVDCGHVNYDKNNDITSPKVNPTAPWNHQGSLEHNLEPTYVLFELKIKLFEMGTCGIQHSIKIVQWKALYKND